MDRSPAFLAALASAAVPGLDPVSVEALPSTPDQSFDVAFVQDAEHRRWVVRAPRTDVAGAEMDRTVGLLALLGRRLPFAVPAPKGFVALAEGGRAAVYPYLPGHQLDFAELPPGPGLAAELGRALAALHNTDPGVYEEAGLPSYDADAYRTRRLADLDRAAESGRVPTTLLARWEAALEDVSLWRFAPTATHGDLTGDQVLAVFTDDADASTGKIRALTGWEDAKVADPADDFAALVADAPPGAVETVLEAYAHQRVERPDANLLVRARLVAELGLLGTLMTALTRKDAGAVEVLTTQLRRLDDAVHTDEDDDDYRRTSLSPVVARQRTAAPPALVVDEDEEDLPGLPDDEPVEDLPAEPEVAEPAAAEPDPDDWEEEATHETRPIALTPEPAAEPEPEAEVEVSPDTHDPVAAAESQALAAEIEAAADEPTTTADATTSSARTGRGQHTGDLGGVRQRRPHRLARRGVEERAAHPRGVDPPQPRPREPVGAQLHRPRRGPPPGGRRPGLPVDDDPARGAVGAGLLEHGVDPAAHGDAVDDGLDARLDLRGHPVGPLAREEGLAQPAEVGVGRVVVGRAGEGVDVDEGGPAVVLLDPRVERRPPAGREGRRLRERPAQVEGELVGVVGERDERRGGQVRRELDVDVGPRPASGPLVEEHRDLGVPGARPTGSGRPPRPRRPPRRRRPGPARGAARAGRRGRASAR